MTRSLSVRLAIPLTENADGSGRHLLFSKWLPLGVGNGVRNAHDDLNVCLWFEVKSVEVLVPVHKKQLLTYLRLADKRLGLLINFNAALIKDGITRIVNGLEEECHAKPQGRQEHQ